MTRLAVAVTHFDRAVVDGVAARDGDDRHADELGLSFERGVEIGQVFQLGLKYSEALGLKVLDQNGKTVPVWMGCYGIGVSRVLACIAETHHDGPYTRS